MSVEATSSPLLSIAICTWNRVALLRHTLDDLTALMVPPDVRWELVVVANHCTDGTDRLLASYASRLPLRVVQEPRQGLSHARNAAVAHCRGDYILWTDDDVRIEPDWLAAYARAISRDPTAAFFGGPIRVRAERALPDWLHRIWPRVSTAFGERELGPEPFLLDGGRQTPFGANYAVRTIDQRRRPYDPRLGTRPGALVLGEEIALFQSLLASGEHGWWVPDARVHHHVPARHLSVGYLRRYFRGLGATLPLLELADGGSEPVVDRSIAAWRLALRQEWEFRKSHWRDAPEQWIEKLIVSSLAWGRLRSR